MLQQREVVGNVEDDTDEELLKQVGNAIYAVLDEFNSMQALTGTRGYSTTRFFSSLPYPTRKSLLLDRVVE